MTPQHAQFFIDQMKKLNEFGQEIWIDPTHIATTSFRENTVYKIGEVSWNESETEQHDWHVAIVMVEIFLHRMVPQIDRFNGIFKIDDWGFWFGDGLRSIEDFQERQYLIPRDSIAQVVLHQRTEDINLIDKPIQ